MDEKKCATTYCPYLQPLEERCNSHPLGRAEHTHLELSWNHETRLGRPGIVDVIDGSEFMQRQPPEHEAFRSDEQDLRSASLSTTPASGSFHPNAFYI